MKKIFASLLLALLTKTITAQYNPITVTNYKTDGVAENTTAIANTSGGLDAGGNILVSAFYASLFSPTSTGLPNNGTIINGLNTYQMASYTQSNVLQISPGVTDSLIFVNPQAYMSLSIMNFGTDGAATMSLTVRFTDNTTQGFSSTGVQDWFNGTGAVISGFDRALRSTGALAYASGNPRFYSSNVFISCSNRLKPIRAVLFTNQASGITRLSIAGVSGVQSPIFSTSVTPITCSGGTGSITIVNTGGVGSYTYAWGTSPVQTAVTATGLATGAYNYSVTDGGGCVFTSTAIMPPTTGTVAAPVVLPYANPVCSGTSATITAIGAASYTWSGGITNATAFTPTASGSPQINTYTVTGANSCNTSTASTVITLTVNPNPTITAVSSSASLCSGSSLTLTGGGATSSYTWSGGVTNATSFTPAATSTYVVSGSNSFGCIASTSTVITVVNTPISSPVASPVYVCTGGSTTLSAFGAANYTWLPGNSTASSVVVNPTATTIYTVTKANSNCVDTKTISVAVFSLPAVQAVASSPTVCAGSLATLNAISSTATNYTWTPGPVTSSQALVSPLNNTTYTLSAFDGTCFAQTTVALATVQIPTITSAVSNSIICSGESVTLTASGGVSYTWTTIGVNSSSAVVSPTAPIQYSVAGSNSLGCLAGSSQVVIVNAAPSLTVTQSDAVICLGNSATLSVAGASTYTWSTNSNASTIIETPTVTTLYTIVATGTNNCVGTQTLQLDVFSPSVTVSGPAAICDGQTATLTANGAATYTWNGVNTLPTYIITPSTTAVYSLAANSTSANITCLTNNTIQVVVNPLPIITALATRTLICKTETSVLSASGANTYTWSNNATTPTINVSSTLITVLNYTVTGTDANGCVNSATIAVKVNNCIGLNENNQNHTLTIYPNPTNGEFTIKSLDQEHNVTVVNSLGQVIIVLTLNEENNYQVKVKDLADGIYFVNEESASQKSTYKVIVQNN